MGQRSKSPGNPRVFRDISALRRSTSSASRRLKMAILLMHAFSGETDIVRMKVCQYVAGMKMPLRLVATPRRQLRIPHPSTARKRSADGAGILSRPRGLHCPFCSAALYRFRTAAIDRDMLDVHRRCSCLPYLRGCRRDETPEALELSARRLSPTLSPTHNSTSSELRASRFRHRRRPARVLTGVQINAAIKPVALHSESAASRAPMP